jgi:hypothetical protein
MEDRMMTEVLYRRTDGTFVICRDGLPYHVVHEDPAFHAVAAAAEGLVLPTEPAVLVTAPPRPSSTISKIRLVEVLSAMGKLRQAYTLLKLDASINDMSDAELALRERYKAAQIIDLSLPEVASVLSALKVSAEDILA